MALQNKHNLNHLICRDEWDVVMTRMKTEEGKVELRRKDVDFDNLPLHWACWRGAPFELVKAMLDEYPEAAKKTNRATYLPLHCACICDDVSPPVVQLLLDAYPEGAKAADEYAHPKGVAIVATLCQYGNLPLHHAAYHNAPLEVLNTLVDAHPEGVTTCNLNGELPLHRLAYGASPRKEADVEKIKLLIEPLLNNKGACRTAAGRDRMLPLHVASRFRLSIEILRALLATYADAAMELCKYRGQEVYAIDLLEVRRPECGTEEEESSRVERTSITASLIADATAAGVVAGITPRGSDPCTLGPGEGAAAQKLASSPIVDDCIYASVVNQRLASNVSEVNRSDESTKQQPMTIVEEQDLEFNETSDLLFSYNPDVLPHRKDNERLRRFVDLITQETREHNLSDHLRRVWIWMCTFANEDDPSDNYVSQINAILGGLGDRKLVKWLASVETPGVRQIREIAAPKCVKAINAHFLFSGRLELYRDSPIHKSATCIVVDAKDFGRTAIPIRDATRNSKLSEFNRVVVKFMSDAKQFDREMRTRNLSSSTRCSDQSDSPFLMPCVTFFDTRESSLMDKYYERDICESKTVFGHDLRRYPHAFVMRRGDRNLDSIFMHEQPRMLKIRSYMEEIAMQLEQFHTAGRIHADIKPLNIVRLDDVLTLIDMDACREIGNEKVGTKFSSGFIPPEMIYRLKNEAEEKQYVAYWKDAVDSFHTLQEIVRESNEGVPDAVSELLEEKQGAYKDHVDMTMELYCQRSSILKDLFQKVGQNIDAFYDIWASLTKDAAFWAKICPRQCKNGGKYVVRTFRDGDESDLPYELLRADISFDVWSFGVLLYKACTKKPLFAGNEVTDDLDDGESYAELATWDPKNKACREKLKAVANESALDLLRVLLCRSADERPKRMREVLCHEFFETDFHAKWKTLDGELHRLQGEAQKLLQKEASYEREKWTFVERQLQDKNEQIRKVKHELKEMVHAMSASELIRCRKWGEVMKKIKKSDRKDLKDLFFETCRHGPPLEVVRECLRIDEDLPKESKNGELPIHLVCCYGAEAKVIKRLIRQHPKSLTTECGFEEQMTPLQVAQSSQWEFNNSSHVEVIEFLRKESFPQHFDSLTLLPTKNAFHEWAHIPPPGVHNCNAYAILLFLDISGFKAVNDKASYTDGDKAIETYSTDLSNLCRKCVKSADADLHLTIECFRMGGDEFAVVGKFSGDEYGSPVMNVWDLRFRQLAIDIACLEFNDTICPPRYSTFFRGGCCAGKASDIERLLRKAEELQKDVRVNIDVLRGESISLAALGAKGIPNFSDLVVL